MNKRLILVLLTALFTVNVSAEYVEYPTNKDGSIITGVLTADFNPAGGVAPIPGNLFFLGTDDFTLNAPLGGADPEDYSNPLAALNTIDGFSTTEKWVTTFSFEPYPLDPNTIIPGVSVRMFEVSTVFGTIVAVSGIVRELTPVLEFVAVASGSTLAIIPTSPLKEMTTYMAVLTNDIRDIEGNDATPDQTYWLSKKPDPWIDEDGHSTYSLVDDATAATLESLRQMTAGHENAAQSVGIPKEVLDRVFEPFFTTKPRGLEKSSGLGLSIVYSIIKNHQGEVTIKSDFRKGTFFTILLPVYRAKKASKPQK